MKIDLKNLTIEKAHNSLKNGDYSAVELSQAYLAEIAIKNPEINAYLEVYSDVLEQAKNADIEIQKYRNISSAVSKNPSNSMPLLLGIPCAIKDNILVQGRIASASSKMLENYHAVYDATVIKKLKADGAVFIGRTNMDEFAMGGSTENSAFGVTKNPNDNERVSGGSSGGSAAAVAMNGALFSLGTDTGGSIRQPASFCGIVGLKPSYGAVSRYGAIAMGSSLDQIGPMAKTVTDCEIVFNTIKGNDKKDSTSLPDKIEVRKNKSNKKVVGVPRDFLSGDGIDPEILGLFEDSLKVFKDKGYEIKDISLPNISYSLLVYYIIMPAAVSSNLGRFDGVKYGLHIDGKNSIDDYFETRHAGFGKEVIRRILLGTYILSAGYYDAYYNRANAIREMIKEDFNKAFEEVDFIMTPTTPNVAFKIGEKTSDPLTMYLEDIFTVTANITGLPAISIPNGVIKKADKSLPSGLQITGRYSDEQSLFDIGKEFLGE